MASRSARFRSVDAYWEFAYEVRGQRRYVRSPAARSFLRAVVATAERRVDAVKPGAHLWRAQMGARTIHVPIPGTIETHSDDAPYYSDRMKPLRDRAKEGRANPKGIPCLYLATHIETAVAEMRPVQGSVLTVAQFKAVRSLRVVNTTLFTNHNLFMRRKAPEPEQEELVWADIDRAFAAPTFPTDDVADYSPTQVIAEALRDAGYDGIGYASSYGPEHNIAVFNLDDMEQARAHIVRIKKVQLDLEADPTYGYSGILLDPRGAT